MYICTTSVPATLPVFFTSTPTFTTGAWLDPSTSFKEPSRGSQLASNS